MIKRILLMLLLACSPAFAADNAVTLTPGAGVTMRTKDVNGAGLQSPFVILGDITGASILGTAGTPNSNVISIQGITNGTLIPVSLTSTISVNVISATGVSNNVTASGITYSPISALGETSMSTCANGNNCAFSIVAGTNLRSLRIDNATWAGTALGTPTNFGTTPTAVIAGSVNASLFIGTTVADGNSGNKSNGTQRVVIATDQPALTTPMPVNVNYSSTALVADPCQSNTQIISPISITTNTTTRIGQPVTSNRLYICYLLLTSAAADNVGIVEGTGGACGSSTAGVIGGTTASNGPNFAANGGLSIGNGGYTVAATKGTNVDFCLITSAATPLAGILKSVYAP